MLEAVLRKNGYWYKQGTDAKGNWVYASLKLPRGASKAAAQEIIAYENARILQERAHGPKAVLTFAEAALFYLQNGGEGRFLRPLIEELGEMRVADITGGHLADVAAKRYPRCQPQSRKRYVYTPVNAIIRANALAERCDLKIFKAPGVGKHKPVQAAPEEWLDYFVDFAVNGASKSGKSLRNGKRIAALVLFLSFTGARISEAIRVKGEDIQERNGALWAYLGKTKNGKARFVKLHAVVVKALSRLEMEPGKPIFGFGTRHSARKAIQRVCAGAGIPYYSTHKVGRHAFAKRMLDNGYTLMDVKDGGGWESLAVVAENYGHLEQSRVHDAVANVPTKIRHDFGEGRKVIGNQ